MLLLCLLLLPLPHTLSHILFFLSQAEVRAFFPAATCGNAGAACGVSVLGGNDTATRVWLSPDTGLVMVDATSQGNTAVRAGPLPPADTGTRGWTVHAIVDHSIIEVRVHGHFLECLPR